MSRWLLAADTATQRTAVALVREGTIICVREEDGRRHSRALLRLVDEMLRAEGLQPKDLGALGVGLGPGSFTGVRVGITFAKTMALAFSLPLVGVGTLESLALSGRTEASRCPILVAHGGLVYAARYRLQGASLEHLDAPRAVEPETWAGHLADISGPLELLGDGALRYREIFFATLGRRAVLAEEETSHRLKAEALGRLAWHYYQMRHFVDALALEPLYLRPPDAELVLKGG